MLNIILYYRCQLVCCAHNTKLHRKFPFRQKTSFSFLLLANFQRTRTLNFSLALSLINMRISYTTHHRRSGIIILNLIHVHFRRPLSQEIYTVRVKFPRLAWRQRSKGIFYPLSLYYTRSYFQDGSSAPRANSPAALVDRACTTLNKDLPLGHSLPRGELPWRSLCPVIPCPFPCSISCFPYALKGVSQRSKLTPCIQLLLII